MALTKSDIDWLIDSMKLVFATKDELHGFKNQAMEKLDFVVGELKAKRETQELHAGQHSRIEDRLDKIDKRLGVSTAS